MDKVLKTILNEELERIEKNLFVYKKKLLLYPKGTLVKKRRQNHYVYYLVYRKNNKIITDYVRIGDIDKVHMLLQKRENVQSQVLNLKSQKNDIEKILKVRKNSNGKNISRSIGYYRQVEAE